MVMMMMVTIGDGGDDIDNDDGGVWFALLWRGWLKIYQNSSQGGGVLAAVVGLPLCLGGFALLWRGWLKNFQNNPQWGGSLAAVGRFTPLS